MLRDPMSDTEDEVKHPIGVMDGRLDPVLDSSPTVVILTWINALLSIRFKVIQP
jgi:hypothetical protein